LFSLFFFDHPLFFSRAIGGGEKIECAPKIGGGSETTRNCIAKFISEAIGVSTVFPDDVLELVMSYDNGCHTLAVIPNDIGYGPSVCALDAHSALLHHPSSEGEVVGRISLVGPGFAFEQLATLRGKYAGVTTDNKGHLYAHALGGQTVVVYAPVRPSSAVEIIHTVDIFDRSRQHVHASILSCSVVGTMLYVFASNGRDMWMSLFDTSCNWSFLCQYDVEGITLDDVDIDLDDGDGDVKLDSEMEGEIFAVDNDGNTVYARHVHCPKGMGVFVANLSPSGKLRFRSVCATGEDSRYDSILDRMVVNRSEDGGFYTFTTNYGEESDSVWIRKFNRRGSVVGVMSFTGELGLLRFFAVGCHVFSTDSRKLSWCPLHL
jgi:hypothetical protein